MGIISLRRNAGGKHFNRVIRVGINNENPAAPKVEGETASTLAWLNPAECLVQPGTAGCTMKSLREREVWVSN